MKTRPLSVMCAFFMIIFILSASHIQAQKIIGFWEIKEVKVGDEMMTPVAKWTKINRDHTFQVGNGWIQNSVGTWTYDKKSRAFLPKETSGIGVEDEHGAYRVTFKDEKMIWEREEEGMKVTIILHKISQLPMSTAEYFTGLWDLAKMTKDGEVITHSFDPDNKHYVFFRWDRAYVERTPEGDRATGYWHIHAHRPEITLLSHNKDKDKDAGSWSVTVADSELKMTGISDANKGVDMIYQRIHKFPQ